MLVPGKEGATLPFTPALSAPADDASFLRGVLEAIPAFVLRLDHEQRIRYVNRVYDGLALDQFIGRAVREFVASEDLQRFEQAISEALSTGRLCSYLVTGAVTLQSGTPTHYEVLCRADGQGRWFSAPNLSKWGRTRPCPGHRLTYAYGTAMLSAETN